MTIDQLNLLSTAAALLADTSHLLAAAQRDKPYIDRVLEGANRSYYLDRLRLVKKAHAPAQRVVNALTAGEPADLWDVVEVTRYSAQFDEWLPSRRK